jgi:hypothetical protein
MARSTGRNGNSRIVYLLRLRSRGCGPQETTTNTPNACAVCLQLQWVVTRTATKVCARAIADTSGHSRLNWP